MKKYGLIMADNGSAMYISGAPDNRWDNDELHNLSQVPASAFEVVQMSPLYTASNVPQGAAASIASFTATPSTGAGSSVTLSWSVSNASYVIISPQVGAVRGTSVTVNPGSNHHLHSLCHEPVRPQHRDCHGNRTVACDQCGGRTLLSGVANLCDSDSRTELLDTSTPAPGSNAKATGRTLAPTLIRALYFRALACLLPPHLGSPTLTGCAAWPAS